MIMSFIKVAILGFIYLSVTAGIASIIGYITEETDCFFAGAWISGMIVFLTAVYFIMTRL